MSKPTGKLLFAYQTIANLEAERDALQLLLNDRDQKLDELQARVGVSEARNTELAAYESFPCYLIDHCEGATVYEENLQHWLAEHISALAQSAPATTGENHE